MKELTKRRDFMGCVLDYRRPIGTPVQDTSQAMIAVSKHLDSTKTLQLLKAAVRALERGAKESSDVATDTKAPVDAKAPVDVPTPKLLLKNP